MKMMLAIINYDDAHDVMNALVKNSFSVTKLATTGGFLKSGNVTILLGLSEDKVDDALAIIKEYSSTRKQIVPTTSELASGFFPSMPVQIDVGGATVFVIDVERFEKL